ncbi:MAG: cytochrome-c oxidase, cbb3-type subunit III [Enhydrobacter sp.]|nr:cytochrome-c oxidase, cbb3-type subunit III [Enhydrobacter sp.]
MPTKIEKDSITGRETTGHEWDGVKELNTPLPTWWVYTFYACIVFAVVYSVLYPSWPWLSGHTMGVLGHTNRGELTQALDTQGQERAKFVNRIRSASFAQIRQDPELYNFAVAGGRSAFQTNCMQCHGAGGAGSTGFPNLVDDDWLWGGSIEQIQQTILFGVRNANEKSRQGLMPRFGVDGLLTPQEVSAVTDYVLSLSGKAKATAEGAKVFKEQCAACHQADGKGNIEMGAPNLTDGLWLYGGSRDAIYRSIFYARNGSMPAWGERLDEATIKMLTLYVHALGGGK